MITDLEVQDYQSLKSVRLGLGLVTVVTGPSSSGKSALIRAVELLARNARGTSYIRQGAGRCLVGMAGAEGWAVTIERSAKRGTDAYRVFDRTALPDGQTAAVTAYTKLGGEVPAEVAGLLQLSALNFAGQFDGPFLLADKASEVARCLGGLTNVTLIFKAAQEAGRRKRGLSADLRAAGAEVARLTAEVQRFRGLKGRMDAIRRAEEALAGLQDAEGRRDRLRDLVGRHRAAVVALAEVTVPPEPPGLGAVEEAARRAGRLRELCQAYQAAQDAVAQEGGALAAQDAELVRLGRAIQLALAEAGVCPTCGQQVADAPGNGTRQARANASGSGA